MVVCYYIFSQLIRSKARVRILGKLWKKTFFLANCCQQISGENYESIKLAIQKFLENLAFGADDKLYVRPLTYKINAHNMSGVKSYAVILTEGL